MGKLDFALVQSLLRHSLALHEKAAKRVTIVITLNKVVLGVLRPLELRGKPRSARRRRGRSTARRRWRRGGGRGAAGNPQRQRCQERQDTGDCRLHFAPSPRVDSLGSIA